HLFRPLLVLRIRVGMQEVDDERLDAILPKSCRRPTYAVVIKRDEDVTLGVDTLGHLQTVLARDQWLERASQAVRVWPGTPAELEAVAKAPRRDQPADRAFALKECVRPDRRAVDDDNQSIRRAPGELQRVEKAPRQVAWRRRHLGDGHGAGLLLDRYEVGKGP